MNRFTKCLVLLTTLLLGPAWAQAGLVIETGLTIEKTMNSGETYEGTIPIRNTGEAPLEVKVYQTDYAFFADGRNDYGTPGKLPRSNAKWLRLSQEQLIIPPKARVNVGYTLKVPHDPKLTGTYWSMVMVEPIAPGSRESTVKRPKESRMQLSQVTRYGIQIVTDIADSGTRELAFKNPAMQKKDGKRLFTVDLENTGERWLRPQLWLELYDRQGRPVGKFDGQKWRIYPGTSARTQIDLSKVAAGQYVALIAADSGGDDLFGTQIELTVR